VSNRGLRADLWDAGAGLGADGGVHCGGVIGAAAVESAGGEMERFGAR